MPWGYDVGTPSPRGRRVGVSVMVAAEIRGEVKNIKFVRAARPTIKELVMEVENAFQKEDENFAVRELQIYADDLQLWEPLTRQAQIRNNSQLYAKRCQDDQTPRRRRTRSNTPQRSQSRALGDRLCALYKEFCGPRGDLRHFKDKLLSHGIDSVDLLQSIRDAVGHGATKISIAQFNRWGRRNPTYVRTLWGPNKRPLLKAISPPRPLDPPAPTVPHPMLLSPSRSRRASSPSHAWFPPTEEELLQYSPRWRDEQHMPVKAWLSSELKRLEDEHQQKVADLYARVHAMG
eukprot:TRINITY_DN7850_c0_g3_i1.p1 TRINITY_DN7850_c0_g3~~TRINITY_DN7850_c0_g3_i1.p1  ORF type:complete len:312 (+),score=9.95 TRINITY_DN7850_c0_g3_i1:68-937(+)